MKKRILIFEHESCIPNPKAYRVGGTGGWGCKTGHDSSVCTALVVLPTRSDLECWWIRRIRKRLTWRIRNVSERIRTNPLSLLEYDNPTDSSALYVSDTSFLEYGVSGEIRDFYWKFHIEYNLQQYTARGYETCIRQLPNRHSVLSGRQEPLVRETAFHLTLSVLYMTSPETTIVIWNGLRIDGNVV